MCYNICVYWNLINYSGLNHDIFEARICKDKQKEEEKKILQVDVMHSYIDLSESFDVW